MDGEREENIDTDPAHCRQNAALLIRNASASPMVGNSTAQWMRLSAAASAPSRTLPRAMCTTGSPFPSEGPPEVPDPPLVKAIWLGGVGGTSLIFAGGIAMGHNTLLPAWAFFHGAGATASALKKNAFETVMHAGICKKDTFDTFLTPLFLTLHLPALSLNSPISLPRPLHNFPCCHPQVSPCIGMHPHTGPLRRDPLPCLPSSCDHVNKSR